MSPVVRFCTPLEFRLSGETWPRSPIERNQVRRQVRFFDNYAGIEFEKLNLVEITESLKSDNTRFDWIADTGAALSFQPDFVLQIQVSSPEMARSFICCSFS